MASSLEKPPALNTVTDAYDTLPVGVALGVASIHCVGVYLGVVMIGTDIAHKIVQVVIST